jgi:hypothetical protein
MAPECWFNPRAFQTFFHKKQLEAASGRDVIGSHPLVTALTASSEARRYPPHIAEITSGTWRGR